MTQRSLHWDGASIGDADALTINAADGIGYRLGNEDYESPFVDRMFRMLWNGDEDRGILKNWLNELVVAGVATPVTVDTGGAIVYGMPYENTSSVNVAVTSPTTDTRQDLIVLRRNWSAQTIRITKIDGVEGGGVPAYTQSPAPSGTGIYDIPLASLSVTTGGVITVTDLRESCLFGTGAGDDSFDTAQISNDSIDFPDRETRETRIFIGASDMEAILDTSRFSYWTQSTSFTYATMNGTAVWDGAANADGWTPTGSSYRGIQGGIYLPPANWAGGDVETYVWWVSSAAVASSFAIVTVAQLPVYTTFSGGYPIYLPSASEGIIETTVVNDVYLTQGVTIGGATLDYISPYGYNDDFTCTYGIFWYNPAGAEDIDFLGVEFRYTGYV